MSEFREKLLSGETIAATWVKTPHPHVIEVLALAGLDALAIDAEHAPFGRADIDLAILAARANESPILVRVATASHEVILQALDCGADGIIAPHIRSAAEAEALVRACHYGPGGRGFAGSTRAAGYTSKGMTKARNDAKNVTVIAQIEDAEALEEIDAIAAVDGIDALFIGRIDLTISLGCETPNDAAVVGAVERICAAGRDANRRVGMFLSDLTEIPRWRELGVSLFIPSSDQDFMIRGARALGEAIRSS